MSPSILSFSADLFFLENSGAACFGVAPEERGGRGVSAGFAKVAQRFGTCNRAQNHGIRPLKMDVYTESYTGVHGRNELSALSVAKSFQASRMFGRRGVGAFEFSKHRNTSMCVPSRVEREEMNRSVSFGAVRLWQSGEGLRFCWPVC